MTDESAPESVAEPGGPRSQAIRLGSRFTAKQPLIDWRRAFAKEVNELFRRRLRVATAVLLVLHGTAFVVFEDPNPSPLGRVLRIALIPFSAGLLASTWVKGLGQWVRALAALMIAGVSGYAAWVNSTSGDPLDIRALTLSLVTAGLLFPFTARAMLALSLSVLGFYFCAATLSQKSDPKELAGGIFFLVGASTLATIAASLSSRLRENEYRARFDLERANEQTESLLRNMLPGPIVDRLKRDGGSVADRHAEATVMFVDIVGFTTMSAAMSPELVVRFLNDLFSDLDALTTERGLEKIKTIGDAYMVAGGLPAPRPDHAEAVASLALATRALVSRLETPGGQQLDVRIGIHTGPVVAGVIGVTKLTYDLWGDTVNTASRMESHGEPGMIQVSEATYTLLRDKFELSSRGTVQIKGKGPMNVYALLGPTQSKGETVAG